jgi:hypothetical protein
LRTVMFCDVELALIASYVHTVPLSIIRFFER